MSVALVQEPEAAPGLASVPSQNGSKGGRPTSLERLGIKSQDIWNLAAQGLTNSEIAKRLSRSKGKISLRTIAKYRAEMPTGYEARFDEFNSMPGVKEFKEWLVTKNDDQHASDAIYSTVGRVWKAVWKKPLESLEEQDLIRALAWVKENQPGNQFHFIIAIRSLIRFGYGKPEWLTKHLTTKGKKNAPRTVGILTKPDFFDKIFPRILASVFELDISEREKDELWLILNLKCATGIRTGKLVDKGKAIERELWGTRINAGKTNLQYQGGSIRDWTVFAKKKEIWKINFLPDSIRLRLNQLIAKYQIKTGEPLIQATTIANGRKYLIQICKKLDIEKLRLHDLRKAYLTGLCVSGVPLETAVELNVGWKDINTARKFYVMIKALNAKDEYAKFTGRFFTH